MSRKESGQDIPFEDLLRAIGVASPFLQPAPQFALRFVGNETGHQQAIAEESGDLFALRP